MSRTRARECGSVTARAEEVDRCGVVAGVRDDVPAVPAFPVVQAFPQRAFDGGLVRAAGAEPALQHPARQRRHHAVGRPPRHAGHVDHRVRADVRLRRQQRIRAGHLDPRGLPRLPQLEMVVVGLGLTERRDQHRAQRGGPLGDVLLPAQLPGAPVRLGPDEVVLPVRVRARLPQRGGDVGLVRHLPAPLRCTHPRLLIFGGTSVAKPWTGAVGQRIAVTPSPAGRRIAYAVTGSGPPLVYVSGWLGHLELSWAIPAERAWYEALADGRT